jgi:sugar phosphate isomerase/epimerase
MSTGRSGNPFAALAPPLAPTVAGCGTGPREAMIAVAEAGFRHVQLSSTQAGTRPRELNRSARRDLAASLRRRELTAAGLDCWVPTAHFVEDAHADRAVAAVTAAIGLAADLGRIPVSVSLPDPDDHTATLWSSLRASAERHEVRLANHAITPEQEPASWIDGPFGLGLDPAAWLAAGRDPVDAVLRHAAALVSTRLVDLLPGGGRGPLGPPGSGRLDVPRYRAALHAAGFGRPVVLDTRTWPDPLDGMRRSAEIWTAAV